LTARLISVGNSSGLVIDKAIVDMLSINRDTHLAILGSGQGSSATGRRQGL
jgi:hypothetical protein